MLWTALPTPLHAQQRETWAEYFSRTGQLEDAESAHWEQTYDELCELRAHKLDINRCSREDLQRLPFLSDRQIMDLMEYRDRAGRLESPLELRMIPSMDRQDADMLEQFIFFGAEASADTLPSWRHIIRHGRHQLTTLVKIPFYRRDGDRNGYLGYPYKHWLRYAFSAGPRVKAGFVAAQDAGEPFFAGKNAAGYDYYTLYIMVRDAGRLRNLVLGRYRLRFGMGLVMNNSFGLGKLNTLAMLGRTTNAVFAHSSRSEANYLQGAAATYRIARGLELTTFASWRKVDVTLNADSTSIATLLTSGYHRTARELRRKRNASTALWGGHFGVNAGRFRLGTTAIYASFDRELRPDVSRCYRQWHPAGRRFWNVGMDYGYVSSRLTIAGETATGTRNAVATLNTVSYRLCSNLSFMALQRYYPYQYYPLYGQSFSDGGAVNNESGVYLGGVWMPAAGVNVLFYTDAAYFAWPRYRASQSSHSWDNLVQVTRDRGSWSLLARYRLRMREQDNPGHSALTYKREHRGRLAATYASHHWTAKTQADLACCHFAQNSLGCMITENLGYVHRRFRLHATVGYFHTDDYNSRLYTYEPGMLHEFSFPSFWGHGIRYALTARAELGRHALVLAKIATTDYFDRSQIGSGLQTIRVSSMTDMELQLRLQL